MVYLFRMKFFHSICESHIYISNVATTLLLPKCNQIKLLHKRSNKIRLQKHHPTHWMIQHRMIQHRTNASAQSCTQGVTKRWISPDSKVRRITQERNIIWGFLTCYVRGFRWLFICMNSHKDVDCGSFPKRCHLISCFQWKPSILVQQSLSSSGTLMDDVLQ